MARFNTRKSIINKCIKEAERQIKKIDNILNANPLSELFTLEVETIKKSLKLIEQGKYLEAEELSKNSKNKKKKLLKLFEKSKDCGKLIEKKVELEFELDLLKRQLYFINIEERKFNQSK